MSDPVFNEGPVRTYAYFQVADGYRGVLEKKPFYDRANATFETLRCALYEPPYWQYEFGQWNYTTDIELPRNEERTDFFGSPRYFEVIVDRSRFADYLQRLNEQAAVHCVTVELVDAAQFTFATGVWKRVSL